MMDINWKKPLQYLRLQIKRVVRAIPSVFVLTLLLLLVVAAFGAAVLSDQASDEKMIKVETGIVGDASESYLGIGIMALQQLDSVRFSVNMKEYEKEEAVAALAAGEISAFCEIPDGFVESVVSGENMQVTCYTSNGQLGLSTMLIKEVLSSVSEMIIQSQNAIYSLQDICLEYGLEDLLWPATEEINIRYINLIINRDQVYEMEILGIADQLSMVAYYICGLIVLFFLIWGVNGCPLFVRRDMSLAKLLSANGRGVISQVLCEYVAYLLLMVISFLGIAVLLGGACEFQELSFDEWSTIDFGVVMSFAIRLLPVAAMLTAMAMLGHELVSNIISGMLLQFLLAIVMGYLSGCFYPSSFLPEVIQLLGRILPSGVAMAYASSCIRDVLQVGNVLAVSGYLVVFIAGTALLRHRKLARN